MKKVFNIKNDLKKIEKNIIKNLVEAQVQTAKQIQKDAKERAPKNTGAYAESIIVEPTKVEENKISTFIGSSMTVSSKGKGNIYNLGYLLETGTSPHLIFPVNSNVLHFQIDGVDVFTKYVQHPGTTAMPHYNPALLKNKSLHKKNIKNAIKKAIKEAK